MFVNGENKSEVGARQCNDSFSCMPQKFQKFIILDKVVAEANTQ